MRWLLVLCLIACSHKTAKRAPEDAAAQAKDAAIGVPADAFVSEVTKRAKRLDIAKLSRTCAKDSDCKLVDVHPCGRCVCDDTPIAAADEAKYSAMVTAACADTANSEATTVWNCIECEAMAPACEAGQCIARSTAPPRLDAECKTDADCVVSCEKKGECCPMTGCENVVPRAGAIEAATFNRDNCDAEVRASCPRERPRDYIVPRCKSGTCYGEFLTK